MLFPTYSQTDGRAESVANLQSGRLTRRSVSTANNLCPRREWSARARHDMDEARRVSEGASESIELARGTIVKRVSRRHVEPCPRREWSARARHDMDEARRVSEGASESIELARGTIVKRVSRRHVEPCPRREWSARARHDMDKARKGERVRERINRTCAWNYHEACQQAAR